MTPDELRPILADALMGWTGHEESLRELDAALGDGDLGITVRTGARAAAAVFKDGEPNDLGDLIREAAQAFATANPSTFAALVGAGALAGASTLTARTEYGRVEAVAFLQSFSDKIQQRGKAELGDKTLLDALLPSLDVLTAGEGVNASQLCGSMASAAHEAVERTSTLPSKRGRAGWMGERSIGHADAGATAFALFLDELSVRLAVQA